MLRGIQKASSSWLGKGVLIAVMGLLVISFAIWGIGDIFRGFGQSTLAKIGRTEIGIEQYRQYYSDRLQQLSRRVGRPITPDQARALGLDRQILGQLIAETTMSERARDLRLGVGDAEIARRIMQNEAFQGVNKQFDRYTFEQMIRQAGFTEPRYVAEQRQVILRRAISESIVSGLQAPAVAVDVVNTFRNEKRGIEYLTLGAAQAGAIADPAPDALAKYFEERKVTFRAPEYRKVVIVSLTPVDQGRWITVSDEDTRKFYEQNKASYGKPELRRVWQIQFDSPEQAAAAAARIKAGAKFIDVAKETGRKESDVDLGTVAKAQMIDPAIADAAFALKEGEVSAPVKGRFGTFLLQVSKIEAGQQRTYEELAVQLKRELATERARSEIAGLRDKLEDERAGGATLAETAKKLGLSAKTIDAVDRSGRGPDGAPVPDLPKGVDVVTAAFTTEVGIESDPMQLQGGGYLWYEVVEVIPSRERKLEEVKDQVIARWKDDEVATRLKAKTEQMLAKLKAGATLAQIASENGVAVQTEAELQRGQANSKVSAKVLELAFSSAKGVPIAAEGDKPSERVLFRVTNVVDAKADPASQDSKSASDALRRSISDDLLSQYVTRLEADYGVSINQNALNQVVGGGTSSTN